MFCLPLALLTEAPNIDWTWQFSSSLAYLVVCNSLISISLLLAMVRRQQAARVSSLFFLGPPGAAFMGMVLLGEALPLAAWLGMAGAAAGVGIARREYHRFTTRKMPPTGTFGPGGAPLQPL